MSRPATPKQIAFLSYIGVRNAHSLSFDQASEEFRKLDETEDAASQQLRDRRTAWVTERFVLYPDLYASEIKKMLDEELPQLLHTYIRGQIVGASEKLTKPKIKKVIESLLGESAQWWQSKNMKEIFYRRLSELYPSCVDGRLPEKPAASKGEGSSKPPSKGFSCLVVLCVSFIGFAVIAGFAIANG